MSWLGCRCWGCWDGCGVLNMSCGCREGFTAGCMACGGNCWLKSDQPSVLIGGLPGWWAGDADWSLACLLDQLDSSGMLGSSGIGAAPGVRNTWAHLGASSGGTHWPDHGGGCRQPLDSEGTQRGNS